MTFRAIRLACLLALAGACPVHGAGYSIHTIASGTLGGAIGLANGIGQGSINNAGTAAFTFRTTSQLPDLWTGNTAGSSVLYDSGVDFFAFGGSPIINNSGNAAFTATRLTGGSGVFIGNHTTTATVALDQTANPLSNLSSIATSIDANDQGRVAFHALVGGSAKAMYSGNGGPLALIADTNSTFAEIDTAPAINSAGVVSFRGRQTNLSGPTGIFTGSGGPVTTLYDPSGPFASFGFQTDINDAGTVAFKATLDGGASGIFKGNGGPATTVVDNAGPFSSFLDVAINNCGLVAFEATRDATGLQLGIYTGPDPVANKVIAEGDTLLGGLVILVDFFRGLNDKGQIVFHAGIDFGTTKIDGFFLANPIIPGDVNGDLVVNIFDINLVSSHWNQAGSAGDANGDGIVNIFDINLISSHWGEMAGCGTGATPVPEPATLAMAVLAGCLALANATVGRTLFARNGGATVARSRTEGGRESLSSTWIAKR